MTRAQKEGRAQLVKPRQTIEQGRVVDPEVHETRDLVDPDGAQPLGEGEASFGRADQRAASHVSLHAEPDQRFAIIVRELFDVNVGRDACEHRV